MDTISRSTSGVFAHLDASPPVAAKRPVTIEQHGVSRTDDYGWMRDANWQDLLRDPGSLDEAIRAHLEAENAYYAAASDDLAGLRERLFEEMRGRVKEDDSSVPQADGPFEYAVRYREGGEYPVFIRTPRGGGEETILFDGDRESDGADYFHIASVDHSPNHQLIAFSIDTVGSEYHDIRIRRIDSGEEYDETIPSASGGVVWSADSEAFYYVERDDRQRPKRVKRHALGDDPANDTLVYEESDDSFFLFVDSSQSGEYVFISSTKGTSTEYRFLRADAEAGTEPTVIAERRDDELYYVEHHGDYFYIQTNAGDAVDFKIVRAPLESPGRDNWEDWLAHRPGVYISDFLPLKDFIVVLERENALPRIVVSDYDHDRRFEIDFSEAAYSLSIRSGYEFDTHRLRFTYESPSTPEQTYDFDLDTRERRLRKTQQVPSGHDPELYAVERLSIASADGALVPVTILRLKSTPVDGTSPLLLYGYGSYGAMMQAWFNTNILSLVDRGVVYATAHVRGGSEKGRQWYLDGKLDKKQNSFEDFAAAAEALQERGYGRHGETVIYGGSAGGLLVAATLNMAPQLFGGAIAAVPFVDVLNTISDEDLPLTPPEWVEWGNPIRSLDDYETIAAYSPYDNIDAEAVYPPVLATGGLTDFRVTYWEPAKWIARLRDEARGGPFFLKMNMEAGHSGSAARFERLRERVHEYAFALKLFGLTKTAPIRHEAGDPATSRPQTASSNRGN